MIELIRNYSTENKMPLNISMYGAVREKVLQVICSELKDKDLVLISEGNTSDFLTSGSWDKLRNDPLTFEVRSGKEKEAEGQNEFLSDIEKCVAEAVRGGFEDCEIRSRQEKNSVYLDVSVLVENYHVPVHVLLREVLPGRRVEKQIIRAVFSKEDICVNKYSKDETLVENIIEIMDKLELITDLESYDSTYKLLHQESIEGRRIRSVLEQGFTNRELTEKEARVVTISGYGNYPYMKKKWNRYLKTTGRKDPEWSAVVTTISTFVKPLVESIENDTVFFSDWMPELQRYLD